MRIRSAQITQNHNQIGSGAEGQSGTLSAGSSSCWSRRSADPCLPTTQHHPPKAPRQLQTSRSCNSTSCRSRTPQWHAPRSGCLSCSRSRRPAGVVPFNSPPAPAPLRQSPSATVTMPFNSPPAPAPLHRSPSARVRWKPSAAPIDMP